MKTLLKIFGFISLFSFNWANALVGSKVMSGTEHFASVCRILIYDRKETLVGICSGTLISADKIATAAHCFESELLNLEISCGYTGLDPSQVIIRTTNEGNDVFVRGPLFKENRLNVLRVNKPTSSLPGDDNALIKLRTPVNLIPAKVANRVITRKIFSNKATQCVAAGYGLSNEIDFGRRLIGGRLKYAILDRENLTVTPFGQPQYRTNIDVSQNREWGLLTKSNSNSYQKMNESLSMLSSIGLAVALMPGDSGGPLFCKFQNEWFLIAQTHSGSIDDDSEQVEVFNDWSLLN